MEDKLRNCAICGDRTEDYDELPNGKRIWICGSAACAKDFRDECRQMESEAREQADQDNYSRYY